MALGRVTSPITRAPRAIAPLVTTTTSSPAAWRAATSSQTAPSTSARSSPESSATMLDPSLMTVRAMAWRVDRRGEQAAQRHTRRAEAHECDV